MLRLIRRGEIRAAKIGGRGDYGIGRGDLEAYIEWTTRRPSGAPAQWVAGPLALRLCVLERTYGNRGR